MSKISSYQSVIPAAGDKIIGTDVSNTSSDPGGETVNFNVADFAPTRVVENLQTGTAYQVASADVNSIVSMNNAAANTVTIPTNSTDPIPVGATITIHQDGAGATTIRAASGVTLRGVSAGACQMLARYGAATIYKRSANAWIVLGAVGTVA